MKSILVSVVAALTLAGCGATFPGKSFEYNGFECSKNDSRVEINPGILGIFGVTDGATSAIAPQTKAFDADDIKTTKTLMDICNDWLKGEKVSESDATG